MGPRACLTFPSPSALYHVLSRALPAQLWPLPTGASGPSAPHSGHMAGKEASGPAFPDARLPCAASLPTTDSLANYLYPGTNAPLGAPSRRLCSAGSPGTGGEGTEETSRFMSSADTGWRPSAFLYCSVTLSWSLNPSAPPL